MIECSNLKVSRGKFFLNVDFVVPKGCLLTLLGPSGSGKSTILQSIAGFINIDSGDILFDGHSILSLPPNKRSASMVFQDYALFPHMNVAQNIAYGLNFSEYKTKFFNSSSSDNMNKSAFIHQKDKRVDYLLELLHITQYKNSDIDILSGGEQQRVALARAIANYPKVLLLDEPLGALDVDLRTRVRKEIREVQQSQKLTAVYVTHDQVEAFAISDIIAIINNGKIVQIDSPSNLYHKPLNSFVASFLGECMLLPVTVQEFDANSQKIILVSKIGTIVHKKEYEQELIVGKEYIYCIRPEHIIMSEGRIDAEENVFDVDIVNIEFRGSQSLISVTLKECTIPVLQHISPRKSISNVQIYLPYDKGRLLVE